MPPAKPARTDAAPGFRRGTATFSIAMAIKLTTKTVTSGASHRIARRRCAAIFTLVPLSQPPSRGQPMWSVSLSIARDRLDE